MRRRQVSRTQTTSLARRFATSSVSKRYFLPTSIAGCQLWLDAADTTTTKSVASSGIWVDKSGSSANTSYVAGGSGFSLGTINSLPAVTFPGGTNNLLTANVSMSSTSGFSIFFLASRSSSFPSGARYMANESSSLQVYGISTTTIATYAGAPFSSTSLTNSTDVPFVFSLVVSSSSFNQWGNGVVNSSTGTTGSVSGTKLIIGASGTGYESIFVFAGQMGEIIVYNSALSTPQRQVVEGYLAHKWGITKYYSPTTPLSISGCQLWLDGADPAGTGVQPANGATVSTWVDKSGNGRNAIPTGTGPIYTTNIFNGYSAPVFNGTTMAIPSYLITTDSKLSIFVLCKKTGLRSGGNSDILSVAAGYYYYSLYIRSSHDNSLEVYYQNTPVSLTTYAIGNGTNLLMSILTNGLSIDGYLNGTSVFSTSTPNNGYSMNNLTTQWKISEGQFVGPICEIIIFNSTFTTSQRQQVEIYLARKWGISISESFPSTHPYANYIPSPLTEFIPKSITGCGLWMDAADIGTFSFSSGSNISTWIDKSGNGRNMSVFSTSYPVLVNNAQNGNSVIAFAGVASQYLRTTSNSILINEHSRFIVYSTTAVVSGAAVLFSDDGSGGIGGFFIQGGGGGGTYQDYLGWPTDTGDQGPFQTGSTYRIGEAIITTTPNINGEVYFNGTLKTPFFNVTSSPVKQTTRILIGSRGDVGFTGRVAEFLTYDRVITTTERQQVEGYLAWKWGLTASLPAGHPYKTFSPFPVISINFLPTLISGCQLWLDGSDNSSLGFSGTNVTQWRDKSGRGNNLTAVSGYANATVSSAYQNGLNVINFSGNGLYRTIANWSVYPQDAYIVIALKSTTANGDVLGMGPTGSDYFNSLTFGEYTASRWHNGSSGYSRTPNCVSPTNETSTSFLLIQWCIANNNFLIRRNGTQLVQTDSYTYSLPGNSIFQIGFRHTDRNGANFSGYIGEILVYNTTLTTTERQQVESYLAWKWALQTSLPSDHTYKFAAPSV